MVLGTAVIESPKAIVKTSRSRTDIPKLDCFRSRLLDPGLNNGVQPPAGWEIKLNGELAHRGEGPKAVVSESSPPVPWRE